MLVEKTASPLGEIILCAQGGALCGLWFAGQKYEMRGIVKGIEESASKADAEVIEKTCRWLEAYFSGLEPRVDFPLDPQGTPFQKKVWQELLNIPYGHTLSYGQLAALLGCKSARAVGAAVGKNPISLIIPCHRVIGARGSLTGYAGGIERKEYLLKLERAGADCRAD